MKRFLVLATVLALAVTGAGGTSAHAGPQTGFITGRVTTSDGGPLTGFCVGEVPRSDPEFTPLDPSGEYSLEVVRSVYKVVVTPCDPVTDSPYWSETWDNKPGFMMALISAPPYGKRVFVKPGETTDGIDFVLERGARLVGAAKFVDGSPAMVCLQFWDSRNFQLSHGAGGSLGVRARFTANAVKPGIPFKIQIFDCGSSPPFRTFWYPDATNFSGAETIVLPSPGYHRLEITIPD
jgi:hypothetical protein